MDNETRESLASAYAYQGVAPEENEALVNLAALVEGRKDRAVKDKRDVEIRMIRAINQYHGHSAHRLPETKNKPVNGRNSTDDPPAIHLTRQRTDAIAAKITNMLLPSNERSWSLQASPDPRLSDMLEDDAPVNDPSGGQPVDGEGNPLTKKELARMVRNRAEKRASQMQITIDDQLKEAHLASKARRAIHQACKVGTAILGGPVMTGKTRTVRLRKDGLWTKDVVEDTLPDVKIIDPLNFFPQAAESIDRCEYAFEYHSMHRTDVKNLAKMPGFDPQKLNLLLQQKPTHGEMLPNLTHRADHFQSQEAYRDRYSVWKYVGPVDIRELQALGHADEDEDELGADRMCEVWFSQGVILKVKLSPMEDTTRLPYYVFNYKKNEHSLWGYGIPDESEDSARVVDSTWHMMLHNAALTSGPIVVRKEGILRPADNDFNIRGGIKQFVVDDSEAADLDLNKVLAVFQIDARLDDLSAIHERARQTLDEEIGFPLVAQGEPTEAIPTASGLAMLMNAQSVVQRAIAQCWDDDVMVPLIEAMYDWNMLYNEREEIKGDFTPVAYGATRLVQKDMQAQHLQVLAGLTDNPRFAPYCKDLDLLKQIVKASDVDVDSIVKSDEEIAAEQESQQPDPMQQAEQRKVEAEAALAELKLQEAQQPPEQADQSIDWAKVEVAREANSIKLEAIRGGVIEKEMELEAALAKVASEEGIKLEDLRAKYGLGERKVQSQEFIAGMNARIQLEKERNRDVNLDRGYDSF